MNFNGQKIIPAVRSMKDFETVLKSDFEYFILLNSHIGQLKNISEYSKKVNKSLLTHVDLIHGFKNNEYAIQFIIQDVQPAGLISTRSQVITTTKKKGLLAIQRLFLLDSTALETSYKLFEKTQPDFIEVLPGLIPHMIKEVKEVTGIPILAGGLIRKQQDIENALNAGATAVTTSNNDLWN
ncbi:glycerol-3-phosphate responsive antiterminator [Tepidibacillus decaturensis]|uniref:Glycerol uptake operon antiterminator regulatory protein n=1 Tax=Tepidibacillus decaturensis TaxID=1413211 RepID=A0A135L549_9BACI|nr:glycerol-3-phosphate responsive antiterminator [Tepidibacillus decaturensis]KXG44060.1 glycerol-3-phosphate responsive antiterminator GlpP [Tepidibacillus decaturensis]